MKVKQKYKSLYSKKEIEKWMKFPAKYKFKWLEEAIKFNYRALTPKRRKIWEKLREKGI